MFFTAARLFRQVPARWWLSDLSICPDRHGHRCPNRLGHGWPSRLGRGCLWRCLLALSALAWLIPAARALDPNRLTAQYVHNHWSGDQGYPGGAVNAFAQTPDGYLWIGS